MMIQGPQNVYNSLPNLDNQNLVSRPDVNRNQGAAGAPQLDEKLQSEQQSQSAIQEPLDVSSQQVKNLSDIYNTYQSYVNQIQAEDTLVNRVAYGVAGVKDLLSAA